MSKRKPVEADVEDGITDDLNSEDPEERLRAYRALEQKQRKELLGKKKSAVAELVALGFSRQTAKLVLGLHGEEDDEDPEPLTGNF